MFNIDTTGNAIDFGDLTDANELVNRRCSIKNSWFFCRVDINSNKINTIDFVTIHQQEMQQTLVI